MGPSSSCCCLLFPMKSVFPLCFTGIVSNHIVLLMKPICHWDFTGYSHYVSGMTTFFLCCFALSSPFFNFFFLFIDRIGFCVYRVSFFLCLFSIRETLIECDPSPFDIIISFQWVLMTLLSPFQLAQIEIMLLLKLKLITSLNVN